jgi:hypothetical protein
MLVYIPVYGQYIAIADMSSIDSNQVIPGLQTINRCGDKTICV